MRPWPCPSSGSNRSARSRRCARSSQPPGGARSREMTATRPPVLLRTIAVLVPLVAGGGAAALFIQYSSAAGLTPWAWVSAALLTLSTAWLAWGAMLALVGLWPTPRAVPSAATIRGRTCVLMPVCNEDPAPTFARVAAMMAALKDAPATIHFAILSDSSRPETMAGEAYWFSRLMAETGGEGRLFYRRRERNTGRKAGNIADFFRRSGAAYDYAVILDADSLMEPTTILQMIRRMEAEPRLGLIQTLPVIVRAGSIFGRAMQFAAAFYSPVFARGLARLQGGAGPFWGHNAIVRTRAWAESCGLPELPGSPPFGGHILSHDIVEAAMLARAGWDVRVDPDLGGSYEEGPESLIEYARRDRRWCQGNLQHLGLLASKGFRSMSRFHMLHGAVGYLMSPLWFALLVMWALIGVGEDASVLTYFSETNPLRPTWPEMTDSRHVLVVVLMYAMLIAPKLLGVAALPLTGARFAEFGGGWRFALSFLTEIILSILYAPILMVQQMIAVFRTLLGLQKGWSPQARDGGHYGLATLLKCHLIETVSGTALVAGMIAGLVSLWLLPIAVSLVLAVPLSALSGRSLGGTVARWLGTRDDYAAPPITRAARHYRDELKAILDGATARAAAE
ncbi:MAG: glucans biosynthesis glucosyltransferase MdoH [Pseudooceanicola sp.]|nr:glucans biosynthesis glucosyltransferase MdoH [Pseudooceanicola sp.]